MDLFLQDDDLGLDAEIGARTYLYDKIVSAVRYTPGNTDVAPQIAELQAAGATCCSGSTCRRIRRAEHSPGERDPGRLKTGLLKPLF